MPSDVLAKSVVAPVPRAAVASKINFIDDDIDDVEIPPQKDLDSSDTETSGDHHQYIADPMDNHVFSARDAVTHHGIQLEKMGAIVTVLIFIMFGLLLYVCFLTHQVSQLQQFHEKRVYHHHPGHVPHHVRISET